VIDLGIMEGGLQQLRVGRGAMHFELGKRCIENGASREDNAALEEIFELADVTWPRPLNKCFHGGVRDTLNHLAHAAAVHGDKVTGEKHDVADALAQGRRGDGKDFEAIVKIRPELFFSDHGGEVTIGCGNEPHVHRDGPGAAESFELALLNGAQELGLQVERQLADFIEEERAIVREFESSHLAGDGSGECALLMAEELALQ
jgi:hypothetical protein